MPVMTITDINAGFLKELKNAASLLAIKKEPQPMVDLIIQIQKESFLEGYNYAIEVLQDTLNLSIQKGGK